MKKLYAFCWDVGRMGEVEGLFIADEEKVKESIGKEVYFGEILGKHSEIYGELGEDDLEIKSEDQDFINKIGELLGDNISGYNPLNFIDDTEYFDEEDKE